MSIVDLGAQAAEIIKRTCGGHTPLQRRVELLVPIIGLYVKTTGETSDGVAAWLNRNGLTTRAGKPVTASVIRKALSTARSKAKRNEGLAPSSVSISSTLTASAVQQEQKPGQAKPAQTTRDPNVSSQSALRTSQHAFLGEPTPFKNSPPQPAAGRQKW